MTYCRIEALEPRKLLAAVKIMPLGDSITQSFDTDPGYRFWLWKQLDLAGYDVDFVGSQTATINSSSLTLDGESLYKDFDQNHEAHGALSSDQALPLVPGWLSQNVPDVVLFHLGSNDVFISRQVNDTITDIGSIIDLFRATNPNVTFLVAQIIPAVSSIPPIQSLNGAIADLVTAKNTAQSRVIAVDQFTGIDPATDLKDGTHPSISGEIKIADKWFSTLATILPAPNPAPAKVTWLSDLAATSATNGLGPVEQNFSNGGANAKDGGAINLNGVSTIKGLGAHANSEIVYDLAGKYSQFQTEVGIDDEVGSAGSVVFQVVVDGVVKFQSGVLNGSSATVPVDVSVAGAQALKLVVTDGGDGTADDHADWANARLVLASAPTPTPAPPQVVSAKFVPKHAPHKFKFTFTSDVSASIGADDFVLKNLTTNKTIEARHFKVRYDHETNTASFQLKKGKKSVLTQGRYRATLIASGITDSGGRALTADHVFEFTYLWGDANGDGRINRIDFRILLSNFGKKNRDYSQGDFNHDGKVNDKDFDLMTKNWAARILSGRILKLKGKEVKQVIKELRAELPKKSNAEEDDNDHGDDDKD